MTTTKTRTRKVKISRKKWLRGNNDSYMVNSRGHMCCLGFAANQISRIPKKDMCMISVPEEVYSKDSFLTNVDHVRHGMSGMNISFNNDFADKAMRINDNKEISDKMREYKLKLLFEKHGIELTFVD